MENNENNIQNQAYAQNEAQNHVNPNTTQTEIKGGNTSNNNGDKSNTIIIVAVLLILTIGIVLGVKLMLPKKEEKNNTTNLSNQSSANTSLETNTIADVKSSVEASTVTDTKSSEKIETSGMTADERYAIYSKGIQSKLKSMGEGLTKDQRERIRFCKGNSYSYVQGLQISDIYINDKMEVYVDLKEIGKNDLKIFDNAISCGICSSGNGGNIFTIWVVDINGTLYTCDLDILDSENQMKFNLTKVKDSKNIVSVVQVVGPSAYYPLAIDIDGNTNMVYDGKLYK